MKRTALIALIVAFAASSAFAQLTGEGGQTLTFSGEVKTGVFWKETQDEGLPKEPKVALHSMDDAGGEGDQGRYRLNMEYNNGNNFGMSARIQWQNWMENMPQWSYAYGWGNFFDNNLTIAIGKLGGSPWGTGGPEKWKELETASGGGMRIEYKPGWMPEGHRLNVGFVLNYFNDPREAGSVDVEPTLLDILQESVFGISYTNDLFMVRMAARLDSEYDRRLRGTEEYGAEGGSMVYRVEEHIIRNYLPGFEIWALGVLDGVGSEDPMFRQFENWLFFQYAPELFTAQIRLGYDVIESRSILHVKPTFYWNFFDNLISAGASFWLGQDFGEGKMYEGSPFLFMEVEPKIQINFSSSYIAFVYNWRREYIKPYEAARGADPIRQIQRMNLRFCIYY